MSVFRLDCKFVMKHMPPPGGEVSFQHRTLLISSMVTSLGFVQDGLQVQILLLLVHPFFLLPLSILPFIFLCSSLPGSSHPVPSVPVTFLAPRCVDLQLEGSLRKVFLFFPPVTLKCSWGSKQMLLGRVLFVLLLLGIAY